MSSTGSVEATINSVADTVANALPAVEAIVAVLAPEAVAAVTVAVNIVKGLALNLPQAESLWNQIQSGTVPTAAQLQEYEAAELTAYEQVIADLQAKLTAASTPAAPPPVSPPPAA